jgi:hypothetical protein
LLAPPALNALGGGGTSIVDTVGEGTLFERYGCMTYTPKITNIVAASWPTTAMGPTVHNKEVELSYVAFGGLKAGCYVDPNIFATCGGALIQIDAEMCPRKLTYEGPWPLNVVVGGPIHFNFGVATTVTVNCLFQATFGGAPQNIPDDDPRIL